MHDWLGADTTCGTLGTLVVVALGIGCCPGGAVLLLRPAPLPWPAIILAALTSAHLLHRRRRQRAEVDSGPSITIVMGSVVGRPVRRGRHRWCWCRRARATGRRREAPLLLSAGGIVLGAVGLLVSQLA